MGVLRKQAGVGVGIHDARIGQAVELLKGAHGVGGLSAVDAVYAATEIAQVGQALLYALDLIAPGALRVFLREGGQRAQREHKRENKRHDLPQSNHPISSSHLLYRTNMAASLPLCIGLRMRG